MRSYLQLIIQNIMAHEEIKKARALYKEGKIEFSQLDSVFWQYATKREIHFFWKSPVFDRPGIIIGKSKKQRDLYFESIIK